MQQMAAAAANAGGPGAHSIPPEFGGLHQNFSFGMEN